MNVEFVWDVDCPNVKEARSNLMRAFSRVDANAKWSEWRRDDEDAPDYVRKYGSPTVLVDGKDVAGAGADADANCCRIYPETDGSISGVPSVELIAEALREARDSTHDAGDEATGGGNDDGWLQSLGVVPGLAFGLLPKVTCPACWPAYAGVLSAAGFGFLLESAWLLPLSAFSLTLAVGSLAWRAQNRRGYGPFWLGLTAAVGLLVGKFVFDSEPAVYAGAAAIFVAAVWNSWPTRGESKDCPDCVDAPVRA